MRFYGAGIDEAGRGPVLGPMVMAIVAIEKKDVQWLNKLGVKDSKQVPKAKRNKLARLIKQQLPHVIITVSPKKIDAAVRTGGDSLNLLEARTSTQLINRLAKKTTVPQVMLDLPAKNKEVYLAAVTKDLIETHEVLAEFKADENYLAVSAASILAKVTRDAAMRTEEKKLGIKLGSGYPADPNTQRALQEHFDKLQTTTILRTSWKTIQNIENEKSQTTLTKF